MNLARTRTAVLRASCGLFIVVLAALLLLSLTDWLRNPTAIKAAVKQAFAEQLLGDDQGSEFFGRHKISHFSECIGLSTAIQDKNGNPLAFTLQSPALLWQPPKPICQSLRDEIAGSEQAHFDYSRYWHGYRIIIEPALSYLSYENMLVFFRYFVFFGTILLSYTLIKILNSDNLARRSNFLLELILFFLATLIVLYVILHTTDIPLLWMTPTHAISFLAMILPWCWFTLKKPTFDTYALASTVFVMGAIYNFFDFLYNPDLLAFLLGWSFFMRAVLVEKRATRPALIEAVILQAVSIAGYMAMWLVKWLLVMIGGRIFDQSTTMPTQDFGRWLGGGDGVYVPFKATWALVVESAFMPFGWWPAAACVAALAVILALAIVRGKATDVLCVVALALFPILVLELKANHTLQHAPFTFRFVPFALILTTIGAARMLRVHTTASDSLTQEPSAGEVSIG